MIQRVRRSHSAVTLRSAAAETLLTFPPEVAAALHTLGTPRCWRDGDVIFERGEVLDSVLLLLRGRVRVATSGDGGEEVFFRWYQPGEFVGLVTALNGRPYPVDAVAFDNCEALRFDWDALQAAFASDGRAAMLVARIAASHAGDLTNLVAARTANTLAARVLGVLEHLAMMHAVARRDGERLLTISQQDIAYAVGASRQRVNIELRVLEGLGRIRLGYGSIVILDRERAAPALAPARGQARAMRTRHR